MRKRSAVFSSMILVAVLATASRSAELSKEQIEQQNMKIIRQAHASLAAGDFDTFKSLIGPNYVRHCQAMPPGFQELHGTEQFFGFLHEWMKAIPDYTDTISNMIADGDRVAYVSTMKGTQTGQLGEIPASGKSFTLVNIVMQRLENGKVVETWVSWDNIALLRQLGVFPGPGESSK
ncbi:MAG TPA: ester cyclase [Candidatus Krumholzibacteria bacterium]|nr:ester cyclase [Candidatus Krumholzibacteria bacterium]